MDEITPDTVFEGRYRVVRTLGGGAMGIVYLVEHTTLGSSHAVKFAVVDSPKALERFRREGQVQSRLSSPNIVPVTDVVRWNGQLGLVMPFVDGEPLDQLLVKRGPLPIEVLDQLADGLFDGVADAHAANIVHRDLKPANILVEERRERLRPRITDFGLVKVVEETGAKPLTGSSASLGTPYYMAPEQYGQAYRADGRADLWALGVIFYQAITGRLPFDGDSMPAVLVAAGSGRYTPIPELRPDAPERMVAAVRWALQPTLQARVPTIDAMREAWRGSGATLASSLTETWEPESAPVPAPPPATRKVGWLLAGGSVVGAAGLAAAVVVVVALLAVGGAYGAGWFTRAPGAGPVGEPGGGGLVVAPPEGDADPPVPLPADPQEPPGPAPRPPAPPTERPADPPRPAPPAPEPRAPAQVPGGDGALEVDSRPPGAQVRVGGTYANAPTTLYLPEGVHEVRLLDLAGRGEHTEMVKVTAQGQARLCWDFVEKRRCAP